MTGERTTEDIQALKDNWYKDPIWDIEDTEGFEEHILELRQYRHECEAHWNRLAQEKHDRQAAKICPHMVFSKNTYSGSQQTVYENRQCLVELCAAWDTDRQCCGMLPYKEVTISGGINNHSF